MGDLSSEWEFAYELFKHLSVYDLVQRVFKPPEHTKFSVVYEVDNDVFLEADKHSWREKGKTAILGYRLRVDDRFYYVGVSADENRFHFCHLNDAARKKITKTITNEREFVRLHLIELKIVFRAINAHISPVKYSKRKLYRFGGEFYRVLHSDEPWVHDFIANRLFEHWKSDDIAQELTALNFVKKNSEHITADYIEYLMCKREWNLA